MRHAGLPLQERQHCLVTAVADDAEVVAGDPERAQLGADRPVQADDRALGRAAAGKLTHLFDHARGARRRQFRGAAHAGFTLEEIAIGLVIAKAGLRLEGMDHRDHAGSGRTFRQFHRHSPVEALRPLVGAKPF